MRGYMQQLIEAVNASNATTFLDWAPIILSVISVLIAVYIPVKLARKENQIAIFEKLYAAYSQLLAVRAFADCIKAYKFTGGKQSAQETRELYCVHFETSFGYRPVLSEARESVGRALAALRKNELQANMTSLLISGTDEAKNECESKITAIYESLFSLTMEVILFFPDKAVETNEAVIEFVKHVDTFFDAYCDVIEGALLCGNLRKNRKAKKK